MAPGAWGTVKGGMKRTASVAGLKAMQVESPQVPVRRGNMADRCPSSPRKRLNSTGGAVGRKPLGVATFSPATPPAQHAASLMLSPTRSSSPSDVSDVSSQNSSEASLSSQASITGLSSEGEVSTRCELQLAALDEAIGRIDDSFFANLPTLDDSTEGSIGLDVGMSSAWGTSVDPMDSAATLTKAADEEGDAWGWFV
uniref:Uncharacterized protein n=1 Tax=Phaeomonas parva TaxID=124430 RepID=A0A6U4JBY6_9STRA|mmetsp:Transcript_41080/g.128782  ORF Transcript_41080/g.128782 Transcript_41080/m.128782 type:complete len:198 (+) Transcript_41080:286-879(+)